jgi:dCMP deaminase
VRPSIDEWAMELAHVVATRATCARRSVGCVLLDARGRVLATGYNGPARGIEHCTIVPCAGARLASGSGLDVCEAIHAEANALLQCRDVDSIASCYCTTEPCSHCAKLLLNTGCERVVYKEPYAQGGGRDQWLNGRDPAGWLQVT